MVLWGLTMLTSIVHEGYMGGRNLGKVKPKRGVVCLIDIGSIRKGE